MAYFNEENTVEQMLINAAGQRGWIYVEPKYVPRLPDEVLVVEWLMEALLKLNPITPEQAEQVMPVTLNFSFMRFVKQRKNMAYVINAGLILKCADAGNAYANCNIIFGNEIQEIIDTYDAETKDLGSQVLSTHFSGSFYSSEQLPNLMAEAIYKEAEAEGFTVDFAYTNSARASHYSSEMTYSDLYNIFPFDNAVPIIKVKGKQAADMLRFRNNIYKVDPDIYINYDTTYTVACLDYLAFHCDSDRNYDNFPNFEIVDYDCTHNYLPLDPKPFEPLSVASNSSTTFSFIKLTTGSVKR